jgi:O-antigen/teichoic acid export membrane protein
MHVLKYESVGIFVGQTLTTIFGCAVLFGGMEDLRLLILALILGSGWNALFAAYNVVKRLGVTALIPSYSMGLMPLKMSFMFFLSAIFVKVYSYVDSFTLNLVLGGAAVGIYAVAYKLTYAFQFLPLAFIGALYPAMSAQANDPRALKETLLKAEWYLALIGAPIIFGIYALAPEIINMFYSADYAESVPTLQILIFALLFIFMDFPMGALLNASGRQAVKTGIMGMTMVINIIANLTLIPMIGIPGAAVSALISFSFMFLAGYFAVRYFVQVTFFELLSAVGGLFASGAVMASVVLLLKPHMYFMFTIPVGALVFMLTAFATRSLTMDHLKSLRLMVRR